MRPAWSEAFASGTLAPVRPLRLPRPITREWAWGGSTGAGVKVAVIDSGVEQTHPQVRHLAGAVGLEFAPDTQEGAVVLDAEGDLFGHGTACAGIIRTLAPDVELYSVRVLGEKLTGKGTVFAAGLRWALDNGMHVVNMSLSTGKAEYFGLFHELADEAYFRNVMLVAAVNNIPAPSYPSTYSSVFSVAAHDGRDPEGFSVNPAPPVEFGAPGIDISVPWRGGGRVTATGNSFAAPHVAGLVARILGRHPGLTPFEVKTVLRAVADNAGDG